MKILLLEDDYNLAESIKDEEISNFLTFIMFQENYHIELMKKAIDKL